MNCFLTDACLCVLLCAGEIRQAASIHGIHVHEMGRSRHMQKHQATTVQPILLELSMQTGHYLIPQANKAAPLLNPALDD